MKPLLNIMSKEVREMLTPATLAPVIVMAVIFVGLGSMMDGAMDDATGGSGGPGVGMINLDVTVEQGNVTANKWSKIADEAIDGYAKYLYNGTSDLASGMSRQDMVEKGLDRVTEEGGTALLVIEPDFSKSISSGKRGNISIYWIMQGTGILDSISSEVMAAIVDQADHAISASMIENATSTNADVVLSPTSIIQTTHFKGKTLEMTTPYEIASALSMQAFVVPLIVMIVVMMSGSMIIASMGMEKENKTLETLMTMPVRRSHIVFGKLGGAAVVGLIMAIVYMCGMSYYTGSLSTSSGLDFEANGMTLQTWDYALVGISLFLAVLGALALCMILGAMAKDYKAAQTLTLPVTALAMIPFFILMMKDFATLPAIAQVLLFMIPFTHPMMVMNNLMFDDYGLVIAGIAYEAVFVAIAMAIAIWIFKRDLLVAGQGRKSGDKLSIALASRGKGRLILLCGLAVAILLAVAVVMVTALQ